MRDDSVRVITNESGDWCVLYLNEGIYYEGHSIPHEVWFDVLDEMRIRNDYETISDERMENGAY